MLPASIMNIQTHSWICLWILVDINSELLQKDNLSNPQNLRRIDRVRLEEKVKFVNEVIDSVQTSSITENNKLVKCGALVVTQLLWIKELKNKNIEETFWKRRIESNINTLRKNVSLIERWDAETLRKKSQMTRLDYLYWIKTKGYKRAAEKVKQRIKAKAATLKCYKNRIKQNRKWSKRYKNRVKQNWHEENIIAHKEKAGEFWSGIWEKDVNHDESADGILKEAEEMQDNKQ